MKNLIARAGLAAFFLVFGVLEVSIAQNCTVTGASPIDWSNPGPSCSEGGNASGASVLIIPAGTTVRFNDNADTWTGTRIEVYGILRIIAPGQVTLNSSIVVKNGGTLAINSKLNLGSGAGCGYTIKVETGGNVNIVGATPDRLNICGVEVARGGTSGCNPYPGGPIPYCEPAAGFSGPIGFDEAGINTTLPIKLSYFTVELNNDQKVDIKWATDKEENFDHFEVERAGHELNFEPIFNVLGKGFNTNSLEEYMVTDKAPLSGINYFRLKAVDLDGSSEYFKIESLNVNVQHDFSVYPNPSNGEDVNYQVNFEINSGDRVVLMSTMGQELQSIQLGNTEGKLVFRDPLKSGVYLVQLVSGNLKKTVKLVVK